MKIKPPQLDIQHGRVEMSHGSGGRAMTQLINQLFLPAFNNQWLSQKNDQALLELTSTRIVMSTDSHVISPLFFPGGDIGCLAIHGTINDLAMSGAIPQYLSAGFILEEGYRLSDLKKIADSMGCAAKKAGVAIVTGDTKVVEKGKGDGVFITTTGIGVVPDGLAISGNNAKPGDQIIVSGFIGDHGIAIMSYRENIKFNTTLQSDSVALHGLVAAMIEVIPSIHCLRDPTRGGVGTTLNELAAQSDVGFIINESALPIRQEVQSACELLGLDPLYVANEGKLVAICKAEDAQALLMTMRQHPLGREAAIIGEVVNDPRNFVQLKTQFGGLRIIDWLSAEQLPRIC